MKHEPKTICHHCIGSVSLNATYCPHCGKHMWHKTFDEAFGWGGLGIIDLIPVVRDLPFWARFLLMLFAVFFLVIVVGPKILEFLAEND